MNLLIIATILSIIATLPQLYHTIQSGVLRDLHPTTPAVAIVANSILAFHGYQTKDIGLMLFGSWFVIYNAVLLSYMWKFYLIEVMLSRVVPLAQKFGTRSISGGEIANVVPGTLPNVIGLAGSVLTSVGGFYFLIESKIKESKKETTDRIDKLEGKLDTISKDVHSIALAVAKHSSL